MIKTKPDKEKAKALKKMAEKIKERIEDTEKKKYPSQIIKDYYEAIHSLMEALASKKGRKSQGSGTHKKLINWIAKESQLTEKEKELLNMLRNHRNRITYEGLNIQPGFIDRNEDNIIKLYDKLKNNLDKILTNP